MTRREFFQRLKEYKVAGVVDHTKDGYWVIPSSVIPRVGRPVRGELLIQPIYTHRGSRVVQVTFAGSAYMRAMLREVLFHETLSEYGTHRFCISPATLFDSLGKIARGEIRI